MTSLLAAAVLLLLLLGISLLLERNHRRSAGLPRVPLGADPGCDLDLSRVAHDLSGHRDQV